MKTRLKATLLAAVFLMATAIPVTALAGPGGRTRGRTLGTQTQTMNQTRDRDRQRLRDGSCLDAAAAGSGAMEKKGNTYGPGDGTGNETPPQDGTGYGAPSQR